MKLNERALEQDDQLRLTGRIPRYSKHEKRSNFSVHVVQYQVDPIEGEDIVVNVKGLLYEKMHDRNLTFQTTDAGTRFSVDFSLAPVQEGDTEARGRHVWQLQVSMDEEDERKHRELDLRYASLHPNPT